ncbi:MAG: phosphocarrier protein HPr [Ilumatobacteraceae bacterium]
MTSRTAVVGSTSGLHARPAAMFVKAAGAAPVKVRIAVDGKKPVNAASMLGVLSLGATFGTTVTLETDAEGDDGDAVLVELANLLERNLDAEEPVADG